MSKYFRNFTILLLLGLVVNSYGQLAKNSWGFSFGLAYPKMINPNISRVNENYGGFLSIQRNFSEHVGLRLRANYLNITGTSGATDVTTIAVTGDLDMLYYFVPCESVSPFFIVGVGGTFSTFENPVPATLDDQIEYEFNIGFGTEWTLDADWRLVTDIIYHTTNGVSFDGATGVSTGGLLGELNDAYMTFNVGVLVYFNKGPVSKYCQIYEGLSGAGDMPDPVDYERIENIVQKYIPREVVKEVVVEKPVKADYTSDKRWVLVGVNFDFNSERLQSEAYPVLFHAVQVLLQNPDMKIEVQGFTDNIGSEKGNQKLSLKRAIAVKNYLVARGISADRITTAGYGEAKPIADNKTAQGRAMNRRIEFKVIN